MLVVVGTTGIEDSNFLSRLYESSNRPRLVDAFDTRVSESLVFPLGP